MDFKEQYKSDIEQISPSEEQCERIRARVYEEIRNQQVIGEAQKPQIIKARKKPLPLATIAITGASVACLVLVATVVLKNQIGFKSEIGTSGGNAASEVSATSASENYTDDSDGFTLQAYVSKPENIASDEAQENNFEMYDQADGSPKNIQSCSDSAMSSTNNPVKLTFAEDDTCTAYFKAGTRIYKLAEYFRSLPADTKPATISAENNSLGKTLRVYFTDNEMIVCDENDKIIGVYV